MAKAKKSKKRIAGKPKRRTSVTTASAQSQDSQDLNPPALQTLTHAAPSPESLKPQQPPLATSRWLYVAEDVRRISIILLICVGLEIILWYLFTYAGLGAAVYQLINL